MFSWNPSVSDIEHTGAGRYTLTADPDGGLVIRGDGGRSFAFRRTELGWTLERDDRSPTMQLIRRAGGTMVLEAGGDGGRRLATWSPAQSGVPAVSGGTVLLADGDLFQVLDRPGQVAGYDLVGWQGGGAYFTTSPGEDGTVLMILPAGRSLLDQVRGETVLVMFAAVAAGLSEEYET